MKKTQRKIYSVVLSLIMCFCISFMATGCKTQEQEFYVTLDQINLGQDYTDLSASIKFLTFRTDIMDKLNGYIPQFNELYPNIDITYEGVSNYENDTKIKLTAASDWGDIMMIPSIEKNVVSNYFVPLGNTSLLSNNYNFMTDWEYNSQTYGIPSTGNAYGILYNKKVFADAGISTLPTTPTEFLTALTLIKQNTNAIPLYTNYADTWPMSCWDAYIGASATGDPNYVNQVMIHEESPFSNYGDDTHAYAVYKILYDAVSQGLIEDDFTTTSEMASYGMINNGEIGCLVFGSWACVQAMGAGDNPEDIGYMAFPISVNDSQYVGIGPDYSYGINVNSSYDEKLASMIYIKWLTEISNYAYSEGGIPILKTDELPSIYSQLNSFELLEDTKALSGEETYFDDINMDTELCFNANGNTKVQEIIEAAFNQTKTFDEIMQEWNTAWHNAQVKFNIYINE